jgi:hypothetical protein
MGEVRNAQKISVGKPGGMILKLIQKVGYDDVDWIHLAQNREQWRVLVNTEMNISVLKNVGNF